MLYAQDNELTPPDAGTGALTGEMESLAARARTVLEGVHKREKYDLSTPGGWLALFEATASKHLTGQLSAESLTRLRSLCIRWQRLYSDLRFEAGTRPVWNT